MRSGPEAGMGRQGRGSEHQWMRAVGMGLHKKDENQLETWAVPVLSLNWAQTVKIGNGCKAEM